MRRLSGLFVFLCAAWLHAQPSSTTPPDPRWRTVGSGGTAAIPATCRPNRDVYICTGAGCTLGNNILYCTAPNTFTTQGVAGGGGLNQLTGDVAAGPGTGSQAATVVGINGVTLSGLANGPYKFTAGVPAAAVFGTDLPGLSSANTFSGANSFTGTLTIPAVNPCANTANGTLCYSTDVNRPTIGVNGTKYFWPFLVGAFTDGDFVKFNGATGGLTDAGTTITGISGQTAGQFLLANSVNTSNSSGNIKQDVAGDIAMLAGLGLNSWNSVTYVNGGTTNISLSTTNGFSIQIPNSGTTTLAFTSPPTGSGWGILKFIQAGTTAGSVTAGANFRNFFAPSNGLNSKCYEPFYYDSVDAVYVFVSMVCTDAAGVTTGSIAAGAPATATYCTGFCSYVDPADNVPKEKTNNSATPYAMVLTGADILATTGLVGKIQGGTIPTSAHLGGWNASNQPTTGTGHDISAILACGGSASATAETCTTSPSFTPAAGDSVILTPGATNSGAFTLNVNSTSAAPVHHNSAALGGCELTSGIPVLLTFDGTNWNMPPAAILIASGTTAASGAGSFNNLGSIASTATGTLTISSSCVVTTDVITFSPNASLKAVVGFTAATTGGISLTAFPTAGNVNFDAQNWSTGALTIGTGAQLNWRVWR